MRPEGGVVNWEGGKYDFWNKKVEDTKMYVGGGGGLVLPLDNVHISQYNSDRMDYILGLINTGP